MLYRILPYITSVAYATIIRVSHKSTNSIQIIALNV